MQTRGPLRDTVVYVLSTMVSKHIDEESTLKDDLGLDSIDRVELFVTLEEKTGIYVNDITIENVETVSDVITALQVSDRISHDIVFNNKPRYGTRLI